DVPASSLYEKAFNLFEYKQRKLFLNFNSCKYMKKNNYVQQLRADNPVFIVWKKIPLSMKLLFVFCFCFVGLLCANDSYAQRTMISVKAQNLTVKEVLSQIEAQSDF
ncbi:hypothetical protein JVV71_18960, partial [Vibrio cholerae O1]|nr:hypothetical protein [Vibrio cholerae O1]